MNYVCDLQKHSSLHSDSDQFESLQESLSKDENKVQTENPKNPQLLMYLLQKKVQKLKYHFFVKLEKYNNRCNKNQNTSGEMASNSPISLLQQHKQQQEKLLDEIQSNLQALESNVQFHQQSSNLESGFNMLENLINRINYHNTIEALNSIKQKECLLLKCQILTKTLNKILNLKMEEYKRTGYQKMNINSGLRLDTHSHFDNRVKQSLETSLGMESVAWSLQIQKPKVLCQNCKKQIQTKITISKPFIVQSHSAGIQYEPKQIEIVETGVFSSSQHVPNKIINILPNQLLNQVQDKATSFINIEMPLFIEINSRLIESVPQLQLVTLKQIQSQKQNSLSNVMQQIKQQVRPVEYTPSNQIKIPKFQPLANTSILIHTPQIEKSFIDTLKIEESKHGVTSPRYQRTLPQITPPRLVSDQMLESQILPVNYDTRDLFVKSIQLNRTGSMSYNNHHNNRTYSLPKQNHYYHQRFTDSQIKRHLFENKKIPTSQSYSVSHRREVEQRVGGTRSNTHKPTFFETAYYF